MPFSSAKKRRIGNTDIRTRFGIYKERGLGELGQEISFVEEEFSLAVKK